MRRAPARVMPVRAATSLSVWLGASALNERITASPRANDCTKESPGATDGSPDCGAAATRGMVGGYPVCRKFFVRTIVRMPNTQTLVYPVPFPPGGLQDA